MSNNPTHQKVTNPFRTHFKNEQMKESANQKPGFWKSVLDHFRPPRSAASIIHVSCLKTIAFDCCVICLLLICLICVNDSVNLLMRHYWFFIVDFRSFVSYLIVRFRFVIFHVWLLTQQCVCAGANVATRDVNARFHVKATSATHKRKVQHDKTTMENDKSKMNNLKWKLGPGARLKRTVRRWPLKCVLECWCDTRTFV